jgi:hypothetical protein
LVAAASVGGGEEAGQVTEGDERFFADSGEYTCGAYVFAFAPAE